MGVRVPGQDARSAQKYFTPLLVKGPMHSPSGTCMFPPPDLAHTVHFTETPFLPKSITIPIHPQRLSATFSRNFPEMLPPGNSQRPLGLHLSEVPDHLLLVFPCYLSEIAKCREQGIRFKYFCRTTGHAYPSPSPAQGHT